MKSFLAMIVIFTIFAGFLGTVAVMYLASSSTEIESDAGTETSTKTEDTQ